MNIKNISIEKMVIINLSRSWEIIYGQQETLFEPLSQQISKKLMKNISIVYIRELYGRQKGCMN